MNFDGAANQVLERCGSTNDVARQLAERGAPHGTWISTRIQESGRGRLGRVWEGRAGNLYLSIVVRISSKALWTWVPLAAAVGAAGALREMNPRWEVQMKWPNDLWLSGAKLGGLLAEAVAGQRESFIILGLGLNCLDAPEGLDQPTACLSGISPLAAVEADQVRMPVLAGIMENLDRLAADGSAYTRARYQEWCALSPGTEIQWGEAETGVVRELGSSGELLVLARGGRELGLFAEDVKIRIAR